MTSDSRYSSFCRAALEFAGESTSGAPACRVCCMAEAAVGK
jgi:hypothetical protein